MGWPSRKFWERLGFEVSGKDDEFSVYIPGWAWGLAVVIVLIILRAIFNALFA
jgi:hypothetical protein